MTQSGPTTISSPPPREQSKGEILRTTVSAKVARLQGRALNDEASSKAELAELRRCDPNEPGANPAVWHITLGDLPEQLVGRGDEPTPAERAVHAALVLFALHQQSHDDPTHRSGVSLGKAVGQLAKARSGDGSLDQATLARFHQVALAQDFGQRLYHLRGLVVLMRTEQPTIALDYGRLADDLWHLADPRHDHNLVLHRWGRDLHSHESDPKQPPTQEN